MRKIFLYFLVLLIIFCCGAAYAQTSATTTAANWQPTGTTAVINWVPAIIHSGAGCTTTTASSAEPSGYQWHPGPCDYSDWFDVTDPNNYTGTGLTPPTGEALAGEDDTAAIQYALNKIKSNSTSSSYSTVYFPPGTYNISTTLVLSNTCGASLIGSGSATILKWVGAAGGTLFMSNGNTHARYLGITWNGNNVAAVGFDHRASQTFETGIRHEQEIFENFTDTGLRIGYQQILAAAEIFYLNDIFQGNGTGISFLSFNDYDNRFLKDEFINNNIGILGGGGIYDVTETNFYNNKTADIDGNTASLRFNSITSQGSGQFLNGAGPQEYIVQNVQVSNWTNPNGAIFLGGSTGVISIFDAALSNSSASAGSPIQVQNQILTTSNISWSGPAGVPMISYGKYNTSSKIINIPSTTSITPLMTSFVDPAYSTPTQIFNAVQYGAKGNGSANDTTAVQNTINAAMLAGAGAAAYFPSPSNYVINNSINITGGKDFIILGSGWFSSISWQGSSAMGAFWGTGALPSTTMFNIIDPSNVKIENIQLNKSNSTSADGVCYVTQSSSSPSIPSSITYDDFLELTNITNPGALQYPVPTPFRNPCGILLLNLSPGSTVHGGVIQGPIFSANSSQAKILIDFSEEGVIDIWGPQVSGSEGYFDIPFRVAGGGNYFDQIVQDNQNLTIGYDYVESSESSLLVSGTSGELPGHVTLANTRAPVGGTTCPGSNPDCTITPIPYQFVDNGYSGNVSFVGGPYTNVSFGRSPQNSITQDPGSTNTLNLLYWDENFGQLPTFIMNPNSSFRLLQNISTDAQNDTGLSLADTSLGPATAQAQAVMDDLRAMLNNELNQTGYSTGL